ncbi:hypothetical protein LTR78_009823 [Recurvomyces mirabilis]|uniref:Uncharacterized protein n=1 Tax=Recurvomyces mirabilis TaxID=574656 RepID=A0AAE0WGE5_9PEZI|nr:hypothetical protein LTR78_009823 [Recurvomyces mirabilis]KAK5153059.1 hypothetical protein LTS14_007703 [Recurvomyces mirabilis]
MKGLREFHMTPRLIWRDIMAMLEDCSEIRLHINLSTADFNLDISEQWLTSLAGCQILASLTVTAEYTNAKECLAVTRPLKQIWLSCKNLRTLAIDIDLPSFGCCIYDEPNEYCGFGFVDKEEPTPLEELNIMNYPWGQHEREYWAYHLDWNMLKRVKFGCRGFGAIVVPRARALEEVSFVCKHDWGLVVDKTQEFETKLRSVAVPCLDILTIAKVPGLSLRLRFLTVHSYEHTEAWKSLENGGDDSFDRLVELCPLLETLEIDMHRDGSWPYAKLERLAAGLPRLRDLSIWFALGRSDALVEPKVTVEVVAEMFILLRRHSRALEKVTIHSGAPSPIGLGYPTGRAFWPGQMSLTIVCEMAERDDERAAGRFYISCEELPAWRVRDDQLQDHVTRFKEGSEEGFGASRMLRLAVEGPVLYDEMNEDLYM